MSYKAEYIWIDGTEPTPLLRSKTKIIADGDEPGIWGFDGSSTNQAPGKASDCVLRPVFSCTDPIHMGDNKLVLAEVLLTDMSPHPTNTRAEAALVAAQYADQEPWFGIEQEYTLFKGTRPLGFPESGYPGPQGPYYCGVGADDVYGRPMVEAHLDACLAPACRSRASTPRSCPASGSSRSARSARSTSPTSCGSPAGCSTASVRTSASRPPSSPSPLAGDWNGAGAHTNFSTNSMRENYDAVITAAEAPGQEPRAAHRRLRPRHRGSPHRRARDGALLRVQLRRVRPRRIGPHPVAGRAGQEGLHRGPSAQRQHGSLRRNPPHRRHLLLSTRRRQVTRSQKPDVSVSDFGMAASRGPRNSSVSQ